MQFPTLTPWQFVSRRLTGWLLPHIDYNLTAHKEVCSCCKAKPDEWPTAGMAVSYTDSYKRELIVCEDCIPLYVSNVKYMGIERLAKGSPVPNKFGMLASCRVIADQERVIMLMPQKIADKIPKQFPVETYVYKSLADANRFMYEGEWKYPAVFIADLGKKKGDMVRNLEYSYSARKAYFITAEQTEEINIQAIRECMAFVARLDKNQIKKAIKLMQGAGNGTYSPGQMAEHLKDDPEVMELMKKTGPDPAARQVIARAIKHV